MTPTFLTYNTAVVLLGTGLLGANAGLVGSFAVLRRRSLTGDAMAHAALPGLALAFLIVGERSLPAMLAGALVTGLLGVAVISGLRRATRVKEDAAIGIVLSVFFGAGVVLSRIVQNTPGLGSRAGLDSYLLGKTAGIIRQDVLMVGGLSLVSLAAVALVYKEFKLTSFDPDFAGVQGWPVLRLDLALMGLIALAVVFGLPMVGVVMMAALLILPAASARFWTDRLGTLLVIATSFGAAIGLFGTLLSARFSGMPAGPIIVLVGAGAFLLSVLLAPRRGVLGRALAARRFRRTLDDRAILWRLHDRPESDPVGPDRPEARRRRRALSRLSARGLVRIAPDGSAELTDEGAALAAEASREHRLRHGWPVDDPDAPPGLLDELEGTIRDVGPLPDPGPREHSP